MSERIASTGIHLLIDHYGGHALTDAKKIEMALTKAAQAAGATVLNSHFHTFGGHGGVTGVLMLAESHISIHTWPEQAYAAIDIFMCGTANPDKAAACLEQVLQPRSVKITRIDRGSSEPVRPSVQIIPDKGM